MTTNYRARLYRNDAIDFFITNKDGFPWSCFPDMVIGRVAYDQYLIVQARFHNLTTIDITQTNPVLHLKGPHNKMTHDSDNNKDAQYNNEIVRKYHPFDVPWHEGVITKTEFYTSLRKSNPNHTGDSIAVLRRPKYSWPPLHPHFDKYRNITTFDDEYVIKPNITIQ